MASADTRKQHPVVLVATLFEAGWEPSHGGQGMDDALALGRGGAKPLLAAVVPGLGGVWTDVADGLEVIRLGCPLPPCPRALDPFDPVPVPENVFIRHWERMVYGRAAAMVWTRSGRLAGPLRWALAGQQVLWWAGAEQWDEWSVMSRSGKASRGPLVAPGCFLAEAGAGSAPEYIGPAEVECAPRQDWLAILLRRLEGLR